jgi:hypothetical protein
MPGVLKFAKHCRSSSLNQSWAASCLGGRKHLDTPSLRMPVTMIGLQATILPFAVGQHYLIVFFEISLTLILVK